jgi:hypothetical protein
MPDVLKRHLRDWLHRKEQMLPAGFSMTVVAVVDAALAVIGVIAALQRPVAEWPIVVIAMVIAFTPEMVFMTFDLSSRPDNSWPLGLWHRNLEGRASRLI